MDKRKEKDINLQQDSSEQDAFLNLAKKLVRLPKEKVEQIKKASPKPDTKKRK